MSTNQDQLEAVRGHRGFIAALDQSGGSSPGALHKYGVTEDAWSSDDEMFDGVKAKGMEVATRIDKRGNIGVHVGKPKEAPRDPDKNCMRCGRFLRRDADRCDECGRKLCDRCLQLDCEEHHRGYGPLPAEQKGAREEFVGVPKSKPQSRRPPGWEEKPALTGSSRRPLGNEEEVPQMHNILLQNW